MKLPILVAADGAAWEERLVAALTAAPSTGIEVARRCVDVTELLALAAAGRGRAAVMAESVRGLDADAVDRLHAAQVAPVVVVRRGDTAAEERLHALGIEHLVPEDADPAVVASVVAAAVRAVADPPRGHALTDPAAARSLPLSHPLPPGEGTPPDETPAQRGTVVAVWGPTGAPGRTTVAVTLADEVARLGAPALLVDADVYGGTVAAVLGLLDESPGLAAACRHAAARRIDATALAALCWQLGPRLRVLTGLPIASRWPELRPAGVAAVLAAARTLAAVTVVDCGFCLETDEELSFDTMAPRRNGATLAVLEDADVILAVGAADPVGMQRLVRGLADLRDAEVGAQVRVVLNRVRRGVVPGDPARELAAALERFTGHVPAALLPADPAAVDTALATGRLLSEASPGSPLRRAVTELAAGLADVPLPRGRRRRR